MMFKRVFRFLFFRAFKRSSFLMRSECKHGHKTKDRVAQNVKQLGVGGFIGVLASISMELKYKWEVILQFGEDFTIPRY
jgi:hypothetical protein